MPLTGNLPVHRPTTGRISAIMPDHPAIIEKPARVSCPFPGLVVHLHIATTFRIKEEHQILIRSPLK
jgi:hypothetical protein